MARPATGQVVVREGKRGRSYALRFRAGGRRHYLTLDGVNSEREAELELQNVLADVRRGTWKPPQPTTPEAPALRAEPTFHEFASKWVRRSEPEVDERTVEYWKWALSNHLLPFFRAYRPSQITPQLVKEYKARKLHEERPLGASSLNKTLKVLAQVLDEAVDDDLLAVNPARGRKTRVRQAKPRRTWLELDEVRSLLDAAGDRRALLATMILSGLRVGELCDLRWRSVNLAGGKLKVEEAKTDAGERSIDMSPDLVDELKLHKADAEAAGPDDLVFPTSRGTRQNRNNIRTRVLGKAIERANKKRAEAGLPPIVGVTNHSLRRTFASLLYEAGASPAYVMQQLGHASSALALEVYTKVMERSRDTGERVDALIRGADWARMGTSGDVGAVEPSTAPEPEREKAPR